MDFLNFLLNPLFLLIVAIPLCCFIGILVGTWLSQPRHPRVLKISPEQGRGEDLEVEREDTVNVHCPAIGNSPPQRFIKRHEALNIVRRSFLKLQTYAMWFGRVGTAYTQQFWDVEETTKNPGGTVAKANPVRVSLRDAIYNLFGKELYDKIPNTPDTTYLKDRIEKSEVGVTVEFPTKPLTPEGLPSISSDDVRRGAIDSFIGSIVHGVNKLGASKTTGEWAKTIFILGSGVAIGIVLAHFLGLSGTTVVQQGG